MLEKINWGHGILITILVFILIMFGMVYVATQQTNDMIDEKYYEKELKHQSKIDAYNNFGKLNIDKSFFQNSNDSLVIQLPLIQTSNLKNGSIEFVNWANKKSDKKYAMNLDSNGKIGLAKSVFDKGNYTVRLYWENNNIPYYTEQSFLNL
jgi:archaellum component FlaF (FlaF/FlaG flagellin family)